MKQIPHRLQNSGNTLEIDIYGIIYQSMWDEECIGAKDLKYLLDCYPAINEIVLKINSEGGDTIEGNAMYNILMESGKKIISDIDGICASAAGILATASQEINMANNTLYMVHNPWCRTEGDSTLLRKRADLLDMTKETVINVYQTKSHLDKETLSKMMEEETWMTAEKALENGFITSIKGDLGKEAVNHIEKIMNRNMIKIFNKVPTDKIMNLISEIKTVEEPKEKEEEVIEMKTVEELKEKFPEIYNSVKAEGKKEGFTEGQSAERERIKAIDSLKGDTLILNKAKFEEIKDAGAVAIELNEKAEAEKTLLLSQIAEREKLGSQTPKAEANDEEINKIYNQINNRR